MRRIFFILFLTTFFVGFSQQNTLTIDDAVLGYYKGLYPTSLQNLKWVDDSNTYVFQKENELIFTDAKTGKKIKSLSLVQLQVIYPTLKRFPLLQEITPTHFSFRNRNSVEIVNYVTNQKKISINFDEKAQNTEFNSKAEAIAYTLDNNLYIGTASNTKIAVTKIDDENIVSGQAIHRSEFGIVKGTFWSPEGNFLAFYQKDESNVTNYPLVDITTYPASLNNIKYPMAGQESEKAKIGIYNLKNNTTSYLNIDTSDEHYLTNLSWTPDEKYVLVAEINRDQNHVWFNKYNIETGEKVNTLFEETNSKWTEPEYDAVFLPNSNTNFLWLSERDGFMNIYEYTTEGKLVKQLTNFNWVVTGIIGFDVKGKHVFISGTGKDARESHTFKVNLKSGKYDQITKQEGTHSTLINSFGDYFIDSYSSLNIPKNIKIGAIKNGKSTTILEAENPLKEYNLGSTEFLTLKGVDGTDLYAKITKPANFDPTKKYPVLVYVYGGPHAQLVTNSWLGGSSLWMPAFATLENYIVFTLDNRGSAHRGFAFESVIHRNLGDAEIEDQLTGIDYLKSLDYVDESRIAVNGWSYGGFMTTSLMLRNPGVFTTAVAGGPVTDWKYYEVMYGERYMDTPQENPEGYKKAKVHNYISNLDGKMLLIHGSVDPTVVPQHSMTLLQEAVKQKVQVDFFTYPMHPHNVRGMDRVHLVKKMLEYIIENNK
ncbi:MAG: prolyl oligopeptidase family serine peptidase [Lutibacter sp.]|uniref:S9 family peptidase n=1 Tax=Lutibacter sp. TaxID=1925666 RepID=UPI0017FCBB39|nr:DPP IV N-terminal domain-containing protein [Lutibacter sp.]MBT8317002.1 DPP IV N-terminal domain-containing protein [Lutibacter sp.]NNJ57862.1 prolyl oligopeptidase family serine peptidase [Lutibacter sp.]